MLGGEQSRGKRAKDLQVRLPPSAKLVLRVLESRRYATFYDIAVETGLPERTIKRALKRLRELGVVKALPCIMPCVRDARRRVYMLCYTTTSQGLSTGNSIGAGGGASRAIVPSPGSESKLERGSKPDVRGPSLFSGIDCEACWLSILLKLKRAERKLLFQLKFRSDGSTGNRMLEGGELRQNLQAIRCTEELLFMYHDVYSEEIPAIVCRNCLLLERKGVLKLTSEEREYLKRSMQANLLLVFAGDSAEPHSSSLLDAVVGFAERSEMASKG